MAKHFKEEHSSSKQRRFRRFAFAGVGLLAVALLGFTVWALSTQRLNSEIAGGTGSAVISDSEPGAAGEGRGSSLPFSIDGVSSSAPVLEVPKDAQPLTLTNEWTFGGDFVTIGSYPIDENTVFGSSTSTPDDSSSYVASMIHSNGSMTALEEPSSGETAWEPQDGTGDASSVVWRSSEMTFEPFSGEDNWRIQAWSAESGESVVLGTAEGLNGSDETPMLDAEVVLTSNGSQTFFASMRKDWGSWKPTVLAYDLNSSDQDPVILGDGDYPAATDNGAIWAGDVASVDDSFAYHGLYRLSGEDIGRVFSLSSEGDAWSISGAWAHGSWRVVSFSSSDPEAGCYIGIWSDDFDSCAAWIHTPSPRIVGSMNGDWIVWGAGSQYENAGMYAYRLGSDSVSYLGEALGYSRPSIAQECNVVMIPECDGENAAVFHVGTLE